MDLYLPTDLRHLHDDPDHTDWSEAAPAVPADALWLGGEAYVAPALFAEARAADKKRARRSDDPAWCVV